MAKISAIHTPAELRNCIINGAFDFWQEKEGTTTTLNTATPSGIRQADMFLIETSGGTTKNLSLVRSTDVPTLAQSGFQSLYSWLFTMVTGIASPVAADLVYACEYRMEGVDYKRLHSKTVTFGFWIKASVPGTYSFALAGPAASRSYVTTFTVNGASTWEFKTFTITLDNAAGYTFDETGTGLAFYIGTVSGTTYQTSSLNQWQSGLFYTATGATNWQATTGATFQVAQVSLVEGPLGLGATGFTRCGESDATELAMCQRYYFKTFPMGTAVGGVTSTTAQRYRAKGTASGEVVLQCSFPVTMRTAPSCTNYSTSGTVSKIRDFNLASDIQASIQDSNATGATCWNDLGVTNGNQYGCHFVADSRL